MKIHPKPNPNADLAHFQLHTAALLLRSTHGLARLAIKAQRLQRLAARACHERSWKDEGKSA